MIQKYKYTVRAVVILQVVLWMGYVIYSAEHENTTFFFFYMINTVLTLFTIAIGVSEDNLRRKYDKKD